LKLVTASPANAGEAGGWMFDVGRWMLVTASRPKAGEAGS